MLGYNRAWGQPVAGPVPMMGGGESWEDHFVAQGDAAHSSATTNLALWHFQGNVGAGNGLPVPDEGSVMAAITGATIGHTVHFGLNVNPLVVAADRTLEIVGRFNLQDVDKSNFAFGMHDDDVSDVIDAGAGTSDGIFFRSAGGANTGLRAIVADDTNQVDSGVLLSEYTTADDLWFELGIRVNLDKSVVFGINGKVVFEYAAPGATASLNPILPTSRMTPFFEIETENAASETLWVDQVGYAWHPH